MVTKLILFSIMSSNSLLVEKPLKLLISSISDITLSFALIWMPRSILWVFFWFGKLKSILSELKTPLPCETYNLQRLVWSNEFLPNLFSASIIFISLHEKIIGYLNLPSLFHLYKTLWPYSWQKFWLYPLRFKRKQCS